MAKQIRITISEETAKVLEKAIALCPVLKTQGMANDLMVAKLGDRFLEWLKQDDSGSFSLSQATPPTCTSSPIPQSHSNEPPSLPPIKSLLSGFLT